MVEAVRYDRWFDTRWGRWAFRVEVQALLDALGPLGGTTVLDVGCGTGRFGEVLERRGARVSGIDADPSMLAVAARRLRGELRLADAHSLPFPDGSFDAAVAVTVCEFTRDPALVVAEMARVVRPGGRLVVGALNRRSLWGLARGGSFSRPPWSGARFLSRPALVRLGAPVGRVSLRGALFSSERVPALERLGAVFELIGRSCPWWGAFQVLTVEKPPDGVEEIVDGYARACMELEARLAAASRENLCRGSDGTRWTNEQLLFHMVFGYMVVRALLPLVRVVSRLPVAARRAFAASLDAATRPFDWANYWGSRAAAAVYNRRRMARKLRRTTAALSRSLHRDDAASLRRWMPFPTRWDPFFSEHMTIRDVYAYPTQHFDFHAAQLSLGR